MTVACSFQTNRLGSDSCSPAYSRIRESLNSGKINYIESYGYGISLDSSISNSVLNDLSCLKSLLHSKKLSESELLKIHLALTLFENRSIRLDSYNIINTNLGERMYYQVNGVGWTRPALNYGNEKLEQSKNKIKKIWIDNL